MSKMYEAFMKAEKQYQKNLPESFHKFQKPILAKTKIQGNQFLTHESFNKLKANLISRYAGINFKSILFNGICHGSGCSTTAFSFANYLSVDPKRTVLLVDLKLDLPLSRRVYHNVKAPDISGIISDSKHFTRQGPRFWSRSRGRM